VLVPRHIPRTKRLAPWVVWTILIVVLFITAAVDLTGWFLD
jgi:hypothetical protein